MAIGRYSMKPPHLASYLTLPKLISTVCHVACHRVEGYNKPALQDRDIDTRLTSEDKV